MCNDRESSELNSDFLKALKKVFKGKEVEITITTSSKNGDEDFKKAIEDVRLRKNLVSFSRNEFEQLSEKLLAQ